MSSDWGRGEREELFVDLVRGRRVRGRSGFVPAVDVFRTEEPPQVTVLVDLAGIDPADVELALADGVLAIAGIRRRLHAGHAVYQQIELDYGPFERRVPVGNDVDAGAAEAVFDRGLLIVRLPLLARPAEPVRVLIAVVRQP